MALDVASVSRTHWTSEVYEPSDDSFALVDALQQDAAGWKAARLRACAEIGCGSGYVICSLALLLRQLGIGSSLYATDISQHALDATRQTLASHGVPSVELLRTNLLDGLLGRLQRRVDILVRGTSRVSSCRAGRPRPSWAPTPTSLAPPRLQVFNPPYVPTPDEEVERGGIAAAWAGGYKGRVVIDRVLEQVGGGRGGRAGSWRRCRCRPPANAAPSWRRQATALAAAAAAPGWGPVVGRSGALAKAASAPAALQLDRILAPGGQLYMVTVLENEPEVIIADMAARGYTGGRLRLRLHVPRALPRCAAAAREPPARLAPPTCRARKRKC
jgi:release factor glutamine methyltransferase